VQGQRRRVPNRRIPPGERPGAETETVSTAASPADRPRRALLSVYDKTGIADLGRGLRSLGWELISSGGTAKALADAGIAATDVADHTGSPIMLGHRVVTLHPRVHGGILADRDDPSHLADLETHGIDPIDLVVVNLYPFGDEPGIEMIDIGGPTLLRAAAKNHAHVGVVVDPGDYESVLAEIAASGSLSPTTRRRMARAAFAHTAAYDAAIVAWIDTPELDVERAGAEQPEARRSDPGRDAAADREQLDHRQPDAEPSTPHASALAPTVHLALERAEMLRYGENPHQAAARYRRAERSRAANPGMWDSVVRHSGPGLSYLNVFDADVAWRLAQDLGPRPAAVIVKHANPCGVAVADDLATAYARAFDCDPRSAFGGVVAVSRPIDDATCAAMVEAAQADVIIAAGFEDGVIDRLRARRANTRILEAPQPSPDSADPGDDLELRQISGGFLLQQAGRFDAAADSWITVTKRRATPAELADAEFAWRVCAQVKSNAVVLAAGEVAWGIGAGQQNRVEAGEIAAAKAAGRAAGGACASDAFYPFADGIHAAADAGVAVIVQPGGSRGDAETIAAADERGVAMLFTGERQFRH